MAVATLPPPKIKESTFVLNLGAIVEKDSGFVLRLDSNLELNDDEFFDFCQINRDLRIERDEQGEIIIMAPTGWETGSRNAEITMQLQQWAKRNGEGIAVDSSTGYNLPNKATRSPDASWVMKERLDTIGAAKRKKFLPLCPDFVIELKSRTDTLQQLQAKMQEWIANGAQLGWLIEPDAKRVYVYRPNMQVETIENANSISGDPLLKGFVLDLTQL